MSNLQPGTNLGPYRILGQIGQGGMATVYRAYHAAMERDVAIKVLPPLLAHGEEFHGRFLQEARTIGRLEHPHILPVYDYGETDGLAYLVMRYLDAGTLKERMAARLTLAEVDHYFSQIADALAYAHERGVVHRDVKPANVLVDARGDAFLTDFGIAKLLESNAGLTKTDVMLGTPQYMSPEQARAEKVDSRSDIYSLGIVLYEMVTGRVPFEAETPLAVAIKHITEPLPLPSTVNPSVPPAVERVILKALAKSRDDRYASMAEFLAAWKRALRESEPATLGVSERRAAAEAALSTAVVDAGEAAPPVVRATLPPAPEPSASAPPRRAAPWILGGLVVVVAAGVLGWVAFGGALLGRGGQAAPPAATAPATPAAVTEAPTAAPGTTPVAGTVGFTRWVAGNNVFALALMGDRLIAGGAGGLTVWNRTTKAYRQITRSDGLPNSIVLSLLPEGETALWVGTEGGVGRYDLAGQSWTIYTREEGLDSQFVTALLRLPDGRLLAATAYGSEAAGEGLNVFDGQRWQPFSADFPSAYIDTTETCENLSHNVNALFLDSHETLWVATMNGMAHYVDGAWQKFCLADGLPGNNVLGFMEDRDGVLWAATNAGVARMVDGKPEAVPELKDIWVQAVRQSRDGTYWFLGGSFIARRTPAGFDWSWGDDPVVGARNWATAVQDDGGALWFGAADGGLIRYDGQRRELWQVPGVPRIVAVDRIGAVPGGGVGIVSPDGRSDRFDPATGQWSPALTGDLCCKFVPYALLPDGRLLGVGTDGLWVVTTDGAAERLGADGGLPSDNVIAAVPDASGHLWVATDRGVAVVKERTVARVLSQENGDLPGDAVRTLFAARDGTMWIGLDDGHLVAAHPDGRLETFSAGAEFAEGTGAIKGMAETPDGRLWLATDGGGIYVYADGRWERFESGMPAYVTAVAVAPDGSLWFGFADEGAAHWADGRWYRYALTDGLPSNSVRAVYASPDGTVWFGTDSGIARLAP